MITKNTKIVVLMGGPSTEAEVSRNTGSAIAEALASIGYSVIPMEYDPHHVVEKLKEAGAEVVFIALHGKYGEDGTIQSVLELARIPYTGSGVTSSAITMDKIMSSHLFKQAGMPMAHSKAYYLKDGKEKVLEDICENFDFPVVLKPACEGSTIGIEIVKKKEDLPDALTRVFKVEPRILAEDYLDGGEFTVSVFDGKALPVIQICPHSGQYDYHSKYTKGATDYIVPAPISDELAKEMSEIAETGYRICECKGAVRFDFKTNKEGKPFVLEANSIPGMTSTSLVPKAAAAAGISFPKLCEKILMEAGLDKV
ncbi:D-alanine--D-alanine ligase [uncultured Dialister sp.]|uniref:D-alanine--D-alanine ligase family protein n=1 Tax=uncultured Dialister sp. TaxID=278064 RepID=UPI0025D36827|nr:D-alanine--D-alanine ligase [uncultured Dialister sp.]